MRPKQFSETGATAYTPWYPVSIYGVEAIISVLASYQSGGSGATLTLQKTNSSLGRKIPVSISQTTTTATVTFAEPHGMQAGDTIAVTGTGDSEFDTQHQVASVSSTTVLTFTDKGQNSGGAFQTLTSRTAAGNGYAVPIKVAAATALTEGTISTINDSVTAVRGAATTLTGTVDFTITQQNS